ncbi:TetR/AcrR family transcriptional regulator [Demequina globuliformis]|uniref:TetR/AcrR family transcriptional regulator n=1 Tax=Demequina globuliformis TaxID=676202 RepID=UPI0009FD0A8C|nr:TetR/AcrR family transcriptional regulator [Demequina globuliformis]
MSQRESYHHGSLREALLAEGHDLLAESGPEEFSLSALARRVGVSPAAPYRHFPDRNHLVDAIADEGYVLFGQALAAAVAQANDPGDAIARIIDNYLAFAQEHATYFSVMFRDRGARPNVVGPPSFTTFFDAVVEAQRGGYLDKKADPRSLARAIWAAVHGAAVLEAVGGFSKLSIAVSRGDLARDIAAPFLRVPGGEVRPRQDSNLQPTD